MITFLSCRLLTTPIFPRRLSSVFLNSATTINFIRVSPLDGFILSGPTLYPPSDATDLFHPCHNTHVLHLWSLLLVHLPGPL